MSRVSLDLFIRTVVDKTAAPNANALTTAGKSVGNGLKKFWNTLSGANVRGAERTLSQARTAADSIGTKHKHVLEELKNYREATDRQLKNMSASRDQTLSNMDQWVKQHEFSGKRKWLNKWTSNGKLLNAQNQMEVEDMMRRRQSVADKTRNKMSVYEKQRAYSDQKLADQAKNLEAEYKNALEGLNPYESALADAKAEALAARLGLGGAAVLGTGAYLGGKAIDSHESQSKRKAAPALLRKFSSDPNMQNAGIGAVLGGLTGAGLGYAADESGRGAFLGGLAGLGLGGLGGYNYDRMVGNKK